MRQEKEGASPPFFYLWQTPIPCSILPGYRFRHMNDYYVQKIEAGSMSKSASSERATVINSRARAQLEDVMDRIYKENPSNWPEGLSIRGHDDIYMIRSASTDEPVGFVGWQTIKEAGSKVGYYTIGILPEHRRNGFAKEAVSRVIAAKASSVDAVKAYIAPHNSPSLGLADSLGIPVVKAASATVAASKLPSILGAVGNTAFWDWQNNDHQPWQKEYWQGMDKQRLGMGVLNALLGVGGGHMIGKGIKGDPKSLVAGSSMVAMSPAKDWIVQSLPAAHKLPKALEQLSDPTKAKMTKGQMAALGLGAAGVAGTLYGGSKLLAHIRELAEANRRSSGARMQVTLPTKDPDDRETTIDLPFEEVAMSPTMNSKLQRDFRRRVSKEINERTIRRKPRKKKKEDEENEKNAAIMMPSKSASLESLSDLLDIIYGR